MQQSVKFYNINQSENFKKVIKDQKILPAVDQQPTETFYQNVKNGYFQHPYRSLINGYGHYHGVPLYLMTFLDWLGRLSMRRGTLRLTFPRWVAASKFGKATRTITRWLQELEELGLIRRSPNNPLKNHVELELIPFDQWVPGQSVVKAAETAFQQAWQAYIERPKMADNITDNLLTVDYPKSLPKADDFKEKKDLVPFIQTSNLLDQDPQSLANPTPEIKKTQKAVLETVLKPENRYNWQLPYQFAVTILLCFGFGAGQPGQKNKALSIFHKIFTRIFQHAPEKFYSILELLAASLFPKQGEPVKRPAAWLMTEFYAVAGIHPVRNTQEAIEVIIKSAPINKRQYQQRQRIEPQDSSKPDLDLTVIDGGKLSNLLNEQEIERLQKIQKEEADRLAERVQELVKNATQEQQTLFQKLSLARRGFEERNESGRL